MQEKTYRPQLGKPIAEPYKTRKEVDKRRTTVKSIEC